MRVLEGSVGHHDRQISEHCALDDAECGEDDHTKLLFYTLGGGVCFRLWWLCHIMHFHQYAMLNCLRAWRGCSDSSIRRLWLEWREVLHRHG